MKKQKKNEVTKYLDLGTPESSNHFFQKDNKLLIEFTKVLLEYSLLNPGKSIFTIYSEVVSSYRKIIFNSGVYKFLHITGGDLLDYYLAWLQKRCEGDVSDETRNLLNRFKSEKRTKEKVEFVVDLFWEYDFLKGFPVSFFDERTNKQDTLSNLISSKILLKVRNELEDPHKNAKKVSEGNRYKITIQKVDPDTPLNYSETELENPNLVELFKNSQYIVFDEDFEKKANRKKRDLQNEKINKNKVKTIEKNIEVKSLI